MDQKILNKLTELEKEWLEFRNVSKEEGSLLNTLIKTGNFKRVLEAGTSAGYSGIWLAEAVKQTQGYVKTIEINLDKAKIAEDNFKEVGLSEYITVYKGDAYEIMTGFEEVFDLVFIDGGKDYLEIFTVVDAKLLKVNGILAVDNVIHPEGLHKDLLDIIQNSSNYQSVVIDSGGGLLIALKLQ